MSDTAKRDLLAEIHEAEASHYTGGTPCSIKAIIESLSPDDAKALNEAFNDASIKGTTISKVLRGRGFPGATDHTVQRHRRGACACKSA
jgi:hypothetical protein